MKTEIILNSQNLGAFLKTRRRELKITQKKLADFCDLSHNGISKIEIAESDVKLSTLLKMSMFLGFKIRLEIES